jgi:hypothetical protein
MKNLNAEAELATGAAQEKLMASLSAAAGLIALYSANETAQLLKQNDATDKSNKLLQVQIANVGKSNLEQAQAIALERTKQQLEGKNVSPAAAKEALQLTQEQATLTVQLAEAQAAFNDSLNRTVDLYSELNTAVTDFGQAVGTGFGAAATALSSLATDMTNYYSKQAALDKQKAADDKKYAGDNEKLTQVQMDYTRKSTELQLSADADVLSSAASAFGQKTAIYKVLEGASLALRAAEAITAIQSILNDTTTTASTVAASAAKSSALGVQAQAQALAAAPPPYNLVLEAITVAALIAAGVSLIGGGGGGGATANPDQIRQDRQAAQGTGTVIGDPTAQSASILNSIDALQKDQNQSLSYFSQMVISLKSIETNIGSLTTQIANQLSISSKGGLFDTSVLNLRETGDHTKTLIDQGLYFQPTTVGNIVKNGIRGGVYDTVNFGDSGNSGDVFYQFRNTGNSANGVAKGGAQFSQQTSQIIGSLEDQVVAEAKLLGRTGAKAVIDAMTLDLGKISLKGLTGDALTKAINAVFSKAGDEMAVKILPLTKTLGQVGEGAFETLSRLVNEYQVSGQVFQELGIKFRETGVYSLSARDRVIQLSGGLDNFTQQAQSFAQEFMTSAQQLAPIAHNVTKEMDSLGLGWVKNKEEFLKVVQGLDLTTAHGAKLYAELMAVAPAFAQVADAATTLKQNRRSLEETLIGDQGKKLALLNMQRADELAIIDKSLIPLQKQIYAEEDLATARANLVTATQNVKNAEVALLQIELTNANTKLTAAQKQVQSATTDLTNAYNAQASQLGTTISNFKSFASSLAQFKQSLTTGQSNGNILQDYAANKAAFEQTATLAARGNQTALGNFATVAQNFLTSSQGASSTAGGYATDLASVIAATNAAQKAAAKQVSNAEKQLEALNASVKGLIQINTSIGQGTVAIKGVGSEVEALQDAQAKEAAAQKAANAIQAELNKANGTLNLKSATAALAAAQAAQTQARAALLAAQAVVYYTTHPGQASQLQHDIDVARFESGGKKSLDAAVVDDLFQQMYGRKATDSEISLTEWLAHGQVDGARSVIKSIVDAEKKPTPHADLSRRPSNSNSTPGVAANQNAQIAADLKAVRQLLESMDKDSGDNTKFTKELRDLFRAVTQGTGTVLTKAS